MQKPNEKRQNANAQKKEVIAVQTSHLGASKLTRHFLSGLANALAADIDARIVECYTEPEGIYDRVIPIVKKRKRKKGIARDVVIQCSITCSKDYKLTD